MRRENKLKFIKIVVFLLLIMFLLIGCRTDRKPDKIARLAALNSIQDSTTVDFTVWVRDVTGDEKLGIELLASETPDNYPHAIIALKDGQKNPGKEKNLCIRGQIDKRDEVSGGIIYRIKDAEVIECY